MSSRYPPVRRKKTYYRGPSSYLLGEVLDLQQLGLLFGGDLADTGSARVERRALGSACS